jgi:hypothetical protein
MLKQGNVPTNDSEMSAEEARMNRERLLEQTRLAPSAATSVVPQHQLEGQVGHQPEKQVETHRLVSRVSPKASRQKRTSGKTTLWRELVTENPMYQKELLAQKRVNELKSPRRRFFAKAWPLAMLGLVYYSIYLAISSVYSNAYNEFLRSPRSSDSPTKYAMQQSMTVSMISYLALLGLLFIVVGIVIPLLASMKVTSERERMNWNALLMSRLTPTQILVGKIAPILRTIGKVYLAVLPALLITATLAITPLVRAVADLSITMPNVNISHDITLWLLRGLLLPPLIIGATALLNTTIALYFSLTRKNGSEASQGAMRGTMLPILGPLGLTGLFYAVPNIISLVQNKMQGMTFDPPAWLHPLFFSPNIFSPLGALIASVFPQIMLRNGNKGTITYADSIWTVLISIAPFVYVLAATCVTRILWKRMLRVFEDTPKDASG